MKTLQSLTFALLVPFTVINAGPMDYVKGAKNTVVTAVKTAGTKTAQAATSVDDTICDGTTKVITFIGDKTPNFVRGGRIERAATATRNFLANSGKTRAGLYTAAVAGLGYAGYKGYKTLTSNKTQTPVVANNNQVKKLRNQLTELEQLKAEANTTGYDSAIAKKKAELKRLAVAPTAKAVSRTSQLKDTAKGVASFVQNAATTAWNKTWNNDNKAIRYSVRALPVVAAGTYAGLAYKGKLPYPTIQTFKNIGNFVKDKAEAFGSKAKSFGLKALAFVPFLNKKAEAKTVKTPVNTEVK